MYFLLMRSIGLSPIVEEYLYSAMEDYKIDIMIESGPNARTVQITSSILLRSMGATTRSVAYSPRPCGRSFGIASQASNITATELIVHHSTAQCWYFARRNGISMEAAIEIAGRSRGTPRIANALLRQCS